MSLTTWLLIACAAGLVVLAFTRTLPYKRYKERRALKASLNRLHAAFVDSPKNLLADAKRNLEQLRNGVHNSEFCVNRINAALEFGWSYCQIGTTNKEMVRFRNGESQKILARKALDVLRADDPEAETYGLITKIERCADEGGFELIDIGTSKKELDTIDRRNTIHSITWQLNELQELARGEGRFGTSTPDERYQFLLSRLGKDPYWVTLEELGVTEAELSALVQACRVAYAKDWLDYMTESANEGKLERSDPSGCQILRKRLEEANISPEDIGSSEEKLDQLFFTSEAVATEERNADI